MHKVKCTGPVQCSVFNALAQRAPTSTAGGSAHLAASINIILSSSFLFSRQMSRASSQLSGSRSEGRRRVERDVTVDGA